MISECTEPRCPCHAVAAREAAIAARMATAPDLDCSAEAACQCAVTR